jgi:hypothetical protein
VDEEYWSNLHPERRVMDLLPVLRHWRNAEVDVEWRTPWETGDEHILPEWEMERLHESIENMRRVVGNYR